MGNIFSVIIVVNLILMAFPVDVLAQNKRDSAEIVDFVNMYEHTYNTHDPVAFAKFYSEDAIFMMFNLPEIRGRQAIENWWRRYWLSEFNKQEPERKGTFILNSVRVLSDDVALANIETITGGRDSLGVELESRRARGMWLLQKQNTNWLISAICGMPTEKDSVILGTSVETAKSLKPHIRAFVDAYEDAFNSHDPSAVSAFFRGDADIMVRNGPLIKGMQEIQDWWRVYFSKPRSYRAIFMIDDIRMINGDVAQINLTVTGAISGDERENQPVRQTSAMWVLVRESGKWLIAAVRVLPGKDDTIIRR